jgi:hypothetical protein
MQNKISNRIFVRRSPAPNPIVAQSNEARLNVLAHVPKLVSGMNKEKRGDIGMHSYMCTPG